MKKEENYKLLNAEIDWCRKPENRTMPEDWQHGFIEGLRQAKRLIKKYRKLT